MTHIARFDYQFRYVIVSWRTVAKETQRRYGMSANAIQRYLFQMATMTQMSVPKTRRMSAAAKRVLPNPNCIGVEAKLKARLRKNGSATERRISFLYSLYATYPNVIVMMMYKIVHTPAHLKMQKHKTQQLRPLSCRTIDWE